MIDYLHECPGYTSIGSLNKRHCVLINGEVGLNRHVGRYVLDCQRIVHSCIIAGPAAKVVVGASARGHLRTVAAVIDYLHECPGYASVGFLDERYCVRIDCEVGLDGVIGVHRNGGIGCVYVGNRSCITCPVDKVVSCIRGCNDACGCTMVVIVWSRLAGRGYRTA